MRTVVRTPPKARMPQHRMISQPARDKRDLEASDRPRSSARPKHAAVHSRLIDGQSHQQPNVGAIVMKVLVLGGDGFCGWPTALHLSHAATRW